LCMKTDVYRAEAIFHIDRSCAPSDKAIFSTEFVLDIADIHAEDDPNAHALLAGYDWQRLVTRNLKADASTVEILTFQLYLCANKGDDELFTWSYEDPYTLEKRVKIAVFGYAPDEEDETPVRMANLQ
jgi:hypothetical protein